MLTCMPTYFKDVLELDITDAGVASAVPYVALFLITLGSGPLADGLMAKGISATVVRRSLTALSLCISSAFMILTGYVEPGQSVRAVAFLTVATGALGLCAGGLSTNPLDLSSRHAGVLMGIANSFATLPGIIAPPITALLTPSSSDGGGGSSANGALRDEWQTVFFIGAGIGFAGALLYAAAASGRRQPWDASRDADDALAQPS